MVPTLPSSFLRRDILYVFFLLRKTCNNGVVVVVVVVVVWGAWLCVCVFVCVDIQNISFPHYFCFLVYPPFSLLGFLDVNDRFMELSVVHHPSIRDVLNISIVIVMRRVLSYSFIMVIFVMRRI